MCKQLKNVSVTVRVGYELITEILLCAWWKICIFQILENRIRVEDIN